MRRSDQLKRSAAIALSLAVHAGVMLASPRQSAARPVAADVSELAFEPLPEPLAPAEPAPEPAESDRAAPIALAPASPRATAARPAAARTSPAAAAGAALTAPASADDGVADFTLVTGSSTAYAGGTTTATGTSAAATRGPVSEKPVASERPAPPAAAGPDRSRNAAPAATDWNCSRLFPNDQDAGDQATVLISVTVLPNGAPRSVAVLRDPGHGFGAAARSCALGERYRPALDRDGNPALATTPPITVRFTR
jgi:periplasmic protein TonB